MTEKQTKPHQPLLDGEELLHLAVAAIGANQHPQAMALLKQAENQDPENPFVMYLLAAEHAQIGMFERAMSGMTAALERAPELHMARLQLGMMHLALGQLKDACSMFEQLGELPVENPLRWFAAGLSALSRGELDSCRESVQKGISLNHENPALTDDMLRLLQQLDQSGAGDIPENAAAQASGESSAVKPKANSLFLARYGKVGE